MLKRNQVYRWTVFILFMFKMYVLKENVQLKKIKGKY